MRDEFAYTCDLPVSLAGIAARMAELVDARDSKSRSPQRSVGSIPTPGTILGLWPKHEMKFCSQCGHEVVVTIPPGDNLPRFVCEACGTIHYQNPKLVVGCLAEWQGKILLCRRAIDPRKGYWTLPAGFMENGETIEQAALREAQEEALAEVEVLSPSLW